MAATHPAAMCTGCSRSDWQTSIGASLTFRSCAPPSSRNVTRPNRPIRPPAHRKPSVDTCDSSESATRNGPPAPQSHDVRDLRKRPTGQGRRGLTCYLISFDDGAPLRASAPEDRVRPPRLIATGSSSQSMTCPRRVQRTNARPSPDADVVTARASAGAARKWLDADAGDEPPAARRKTPAHRPSPSISPRPTSPRPHSGAGLRAANGSGQPPCGRLQSWSIGPLPRGGSIVCPAGSPPPR
jgi:hypothetical protein